MIKVITEHILKENFSKGRALPKGIPLDVVVIHVMEGNMEGTLEHFSRKKPKDPVSAHYGVSYEGDLVRYVREEDTAFANGKTVMASAEIINERDGINPNAFTISIEFEGYGKEDLTDAQRETGIRLLRDISERRGIPLNRRHILRHNEIRKDKACPGKIDVDKLVEQAASPAHPKSPDKVPPRVVWSDFFGEYLIVTRVVSDKEWFFVRTSKLNATLKAQTPLSQMPTAK